MAKMTHKTRPLHDVTNTTDMKLQTLQLGDMKNLVYLIEDAATRRMAVIDPAWDVPAIRPISQLAGANGPGDNRQYVWPIKMQHSVMAGRRKSMTVSDTLFDDRGYIKDPDTWNPSRARRLAEHPGSTTQ